MSNTFQVSVPEGVEAGDRFVVDVVGHDFTITVPPGGFPGASLEIDLPSARTLNKAKDVMAAQAHVMVPEGVGGGELFLVEIDGREFPVQCPPTSGAGDVIDIDVPESEYEDSAYGDAIEVDIPEGYQPGDEFTKVIDGLEYVVFVPEDWLPGETVLLAIQSRRPSEAPASRPQSSRPPSAKAFSKEVADAMRAKPKSGRVAAAKDSKLNPKDCVDVFHPPGRKPGDTLTIRVLGEEYEVKIPNGSKPGDVIQLEVGSVSRRPSKRDAPVVQSTPKARKPSQPSRAKIPIPAGLSAGEEFTVEVDGRDIDLSVPRGKRGGDVLYMDLRDLQAMAAKAPTSPKDSGVLEVTAPFGCRVGDVFFAEVNGMEIEVTVPMGYKPGGKIPVELSPELPSEQEMSMPEPEVVEVEPERIPTVSVEVTVPAGLKPGDIFYAQVDGREYKVKVPRGGKPGSVIGLQVPKQLDAIPEEAPLETEMVQVTVPVGCRPGKTFLAEVNGRSVGVMVPPGCRPGALIEVEVPKKTPEQLAKSLKAPVKKGIDPVPKKAPVPVPKQSPKKAAPSPKSKPKPRSVVEILKEELPEEELEQEPRAMHQAPQRQAPRSEVQPNQPREIQRDLLPPTHTLPPNDMSLALSNPIDSIEIQQLSSKSDGASPPTVQIPIPEGLVPGDRFFVEVDGMEYEVQVPEGCLPGETIVMDVLPEGLSLSERGNASRSVSDAFGSTRDQPLASFRSSDASVVSDRETVQVQIPEDCFSGDTFFAVVNGLEFEVLVPNGCGPGDMIAMDVPSPEASAKFGTTPTEQNLQSGMSPSARNPQKAPSPARTQIVEIQIPQSCYPGDSFLINVDGNEFDIVVPDGCVPGEVIYMDVLQDGLSNSRPASALSREERASSKPADQIRLKDRVDSSEQGKQVVEVQIPQDCFPGDNFVVDVDGASFEIAVPEDCVPGEIVYLDVMADGSVGNSRPSTSASQEDRANARPASSSKKPLVDDKSLVEITIPEGCYTGDYFQVEVDGLNFDLVVPEGCAPGEMIYVDLLPDGGISDSRPASAVTDDQRRIAHKANSRPSSGKAPSQFEDLSTEFDAFVKEIVQIEVPEGASAGSTFEVELKRKVYRIAVPAGCKPGDIIETELSELSPRQVQAAPQKANREKRPVEIEIPTGIRPGSAFDVEVGSKTYTIEMPEGASPGDIIETELSGPTSGMGSRAPSELMADFANEDMNLSMEETREVAPETPEVVATLVQVEIPPGCYPGTVFEAEVNGLTYEILVPPNRKPGDLIEMELAPESRIGSASRTATPTFEEPLAAVKAETEQPMEPVLDNERLVEITVPFDCHAGDVFTAEVNGMEFEVEVPPGSGPDDVITMAVPSFIPQSPVTSLTATPKRTPSLVRTAPEQRELELAESPAVELRRELAVRPAQLERELAETPAELPKGPQISSVLDMHFKLEGNLATFDVNAFKSSLASTLGVDKSLMNVRLSAGSVIADVTISVTDGAVLERAERALAMDPNMLSKALGSTLLEAPKFSIFDTPGKTEMEIQTDPVDFGTTSGTDAVEIAPSTAPSELDTVDVTIPDACHPGDVFFAEVNGFEFRIVVPQGCGPRDIVEMHIPDYIAKAEQMALASSRRVPLSDDAPPASVSSKKGLAAPLALEEQALALRTTASVQTFEFADMAMQTDPTDEDWRAGYTTHTESSRLLLPEPEFGDQSFSFQSGPGDVDHSEEPGSPTAAVEITIPPGLKKGDLFSAEVNGLEFEIAVPDGIEPGDIISMEVPMESQEATSTASPEKAAPSLPPAKTLPLEELAESNKPQKLAAKKAVSGTPVRSRSQTPTPRQLITSIEIVIPDGLVPGDIFMAEVDGYEFPLTVPAGCTGGELVSFEPPEGLELPEEAAVVEVEVPEGYEPGDLFLTEVEGRRFEIEVPDGCFPGSLVTVDALTPQLSARGADVTVEIEVPDGFGPGEEFITEIEGHQFCIMVPEGCFAGSVIGLNLPTPRPSSAGSSRVDGYKVSGTPRSKMKRAGGKVSKTPPASEVAMVEVVVPENVRAGEDFLAVVHGVDFQVTVPDGCGPGDLVSLSVPRLGSFSKDGPLEGVDAEVIVPEGCYPGDEFVAEVNGLDFAVEVPPDCYPGMKIGVTMPAEEKWVAKAGRLPEKKGKKRIRSAGAKEVRPSTADSLALVEVMVPEGVLPGEEFVAEVNGMDVLIVVPKDSPPGTLLQVELESGDLTARSVSRSEASYGSKEPVVEVVVPPHCHAGDKFVCEANGVEFQVKVPRGFGPGSVMSVIVPTGELSARSVSRSDISVGSSKIIEVVVPDNCNPGEEFLVEAAGLEFKVAVPANARPGMVIPVEVPTAPNSEYSGDIDLDDASSSVVQVVVPDACEPGDDFVAETQGGREFKVSTPEDASGGSVLTVRLPRSADRKKEKRRLRSKGQVAKEPEAASVRLRVTVESARGMSSARTGNAQLFVLCRLSPSSETLFRTSLAQDKEHPVWNHSEDFDFQPVSKLDFVLMAMPNGRQPYPVASAMVQSEDFLPSGLKSDLTLTGDHGAQVKLKIVIESPSQRPQSADAKVPSQDSPQEEATIDIPIPEGLSAGDSFEVEINGANFDLEVPDGYSGGDVMTVGLDQFATAETEMIDIPIPDGLSAGDTFEVELDGQTYDIKVPTGYKGGDEMQIDLQKLMSGQTEEESAPEAPAPPPTFTMASNPKRTAVEDLPPLSLGSPPSRDKSSKVPSKDADKASSVKVQLEAVEATAPEEAEASVGNGDITASFPEAKEQDEPEPDEPTSRVRISILNATDLRKLGIESPFVTCRIGKRRALEFQTPAVQETLSPTWNFVHEVAEYKPSLDVSLVVCDTSKEGKEEELGSAIISSSKFMAGAMSEEVFLEGKKAKGSLRLKLENLGSTHEYNAALAALQASGPYRLRVTVMRGNIPRSGPVKTEPYVVCKFNELEFQTPVVGNSGKPIWMYEHEIEEYVPGSPLEVKLCDSSEDGKSEVLGAAHLPSSVFFPKDYEQDLQILGQTARRSVRVKIENLGSAASFSASLASLAASGPSRLRFTVISASGLRSADEGGASDPFVVCTKPGLDTPVFKTPVVGTSLSPVWNYTNDIAEYMPGDPFELTVYDEDDDGSAEFLGKAFMNSSTFFPGGAHKDLTLVGPAAMGTLKIKVLNLGNAAEYAARLASLQDAGACRLKVSVVEARGLIKANFEPFVICSKTSAEEDEFQTQMIADKPHPAWNHEHIIEAYSPGESLEFLVCERDDKGKTIRLGRVELSADRFFPNGIDDDLVLGGKGSKGLLAIKIENLGTVADYLAQLAAEKAAAEAAAEKARIEAEERRKREEEEQERQRIEAKKAREEAEKRKIEELRRQAQEEAERKVREEEARIKREEAARLGRRLISVTIVDDTTEEVMAKASLKLASTVTELGQVVVRESKLSVMPLLYKERKPEEKPESASPTKRFSLTGKKEEVKERVPLNPEETLLEAGLETGDELRAKISSAVITASKDCTARIWNAETGRCELLLEGHTEAVCSACISPDCRFVATSSEDGSARIWNVDTGRCARQLLDHKEPVYSTAFSPDSKQVVTASEDGTAKIWVVKTGICKMTLKGHNNPVLWASFSPDGASVTTTAADGTLKIWNARTGICDRTLTGQKPVYLASFSSDGGTFVTTSGDSTAKICDILSGESLTILQGHTGLVLAAAFAPSRPVTPQ